MNKHSLTGLLVPFPGQPPAGRDEIGGKALALAELASAGFPVPPGAVLTTAFFAPWFEAIGELESWARLIASDPERWPALCHEIRRYASGLPLSGLQRQALAQARSVAGGKMRRLAVRSSSPEEDLATASFAGLYESRLGVRPEDLEAAVRDCFASSLDARVLHYKGEHGMDPFAPQIAVIVQEQIDSEVAGVGFSINPINNDYDEAVIAANHGLGTTVVDGRVSPDEFVVNKHRRRIVQAATGVRQVTEWLADDGGIEARGTVDPDQHCLDQAVVAELTDLVVRVEDFYAAPVDIEWARAGDRLFLLQARPLTAWVPLPKDLVTRPEEPRRLYADAALSKGLTTNAPISPFGLDLLREQFAAICEPFVGRLEPEPDPDRALFLFSGGRMYINYSNVLWLAAPKRLAAAARPTDALMAEILGCVDRQRYRAPRRPPWLGLRMLARIPRALWNTRRFAWGLLCTVLAPERACRAYRVRVEAIVSELRDRIDNGLSLEAYRQRHAPRLARELIDTVGPAMVAGMISPVFLLSRKDQEGRALVERLFLGASGNVVVDMGIAMHRLARSLGPGEFEDLDRLAARIEQREMPPEFLEGWDRFIAEYGWRGPLEMDPARPRYGDDPRLALKQMAAMVRGADFDPEAAHRRRIAERRDALEALLGRLGPLRRTVLRRIHRLIERFAGTRDTAKQLGVLFNYGVRRRALAEGRRLVRAGRLDEPEQVFELRFKDLEAARRDPLVDLRALAVEHSRFHRKLTACVRRFPPVIDSRGRILSPPPPARSADLMAGSPISPGTVTGPVRVLHAPDDEPLEPGDVLVAYTTDPGWTPLFFNAAAIVLEVGGVLQHGALVAREFGKPCVVGIEGVTGRLKDGEMVEVDGAAGTVRRLQADP